MKRVLCLSDSPQDVSRFCAGHEVLFFKIRQLSVAEHDFSRLEEIYRKLKASTDLGKIDLIVAEYIEAVPLVYFMRRDGFDCPAIFIPHTNPYPLNILFYFLLVSEYANPGDVVLCGSQNAVKAYERLTRIPAKAICTFGIKDVYVPRDKQQARRALGLPPDKRVVLYTGRFMNDKGLAPLLESYTKLRSRYPDLLLVLSVTHIDHAYYNRLAPQLDRAVLFHRLEKERTVDLYNAADLYATGATSIFETYGKSPLEALACGVPVVVPEWDGFPYYIGPENGALAQVDYLPQSTESPYQFARVRVDDLVEKCSAFLEGRRIAAEYRLPDWARYETTMDRLRRLVTETPVTRAPSEPAVARSRSIVQERYPDAVRAVLSHYDLVTTSDLVEKTTRHGLIDRRSPGEPTLLKALHDEIFLTMSGVKTKVPLK